MRANGVYLIVIINKTPLRNGNCPITDPITEMGVAHTMGQYCLKWKRENLIKKRYLKNQHISEKWVEGIIINQSKLLISQIQCAVIILAKLPTICNNHYCCTMVANGYQYFSVTLVVELNFSM